jgi:YidC/Oxa1 family membrane protein insertase
LPSNGLITEATIDANGNPIDIDSDNNQDSAELPFSENVADNIIVVTTDVYRFYYPSRLKAQSACFRLL